MKDDLDSRISSALANVAIVLVEPKYPENIGAAARSAMNMGISRLIVVRREEPDREKMLRMATHHAAALIENLALYRDLETAVENERRAYGGGVAAAIRKNRSRHRSTGIDG